jgi:hypothetical protein
VTVAVARQRTVAPEIVAGGCLAAGAVVAGALAGQLVVDGRGKLVLGLGLVLFPVALWKRLQIAPVVLVATALTIEQFPEIGPHGELTAHIPLFHGLGGFRPSDVMVLLMIGVYAAKAGTAAVAPAPRSAVSRAVLVLLAAVAVGVAVGVGSGGTLRVALTEIRPYLYLSAAYLMASTTILTRRRARAVLWACVIATGFKAFQALYIFLAVRHLNPRPEAVLGHEESLFFAAFVSLTMALWLFDVPGRLRATATALVPIVLLADLANGRRVAWLIIAGVLIVSIVVGLVALPHRRPFLRRFAFVVTAFSIIYFPTYWNKTGGFAQPARAFHSAIAPDPRDAASNLYRVQEDANLKLNIREAGHLGKGFGVPIDYALPIVDISDIDPYITYIPHNGLLYLFMRMGAYGAIAFWSLIAAAIVAACRLARSADKEFAAVGLVIASVVTGYVLLGYNDQGFFYYRVAILVGALLGLGEALTRLNRPADAPAALPSTGVIALDPRLRQWAHS